MASQSNGEGSSRSASSAQDENNNEKSNGNGNGNVVVIDDADDGGSRMTAAEASPLIVDDTATPSTSTAQGTRHTLLETMRTPSTRTPAVIVLDEMPSDTLLGRAPEVLDPRQDLWLTTADGRYNSPSIPLHVGQPPQTFFVHRDILLKSEYFRKALCGEFRESAEQAIDLPEEDPAIFHFLVAFLYEQQYKPVRSAASVLVADDKGKGRAEPGNPMSGVHGNDDLSDSDSTHESIRSNAMAQSQGWQERERRREDRLVARLRRKHPGLHRPQCDCPTCMGAGAACWNCAESRQPPPYMFTMPVAQAVPMMPMGRPPAAMQDPIERARHNRNRALHIAARRHQMRYHPSFQGGRTGGPNGPHDPYPVLELQNDNNNNNNNNNNSSSNNNNNAGEDPFLNSASLTDAFSGSRLAGEEDVRAWLQEYEQHLDVYICADKFLMGDLKRAVSTACVDMLETAGADAALPRVLQLCCKLYGGVGSEQDPLLKMVLARVGFLQPVLWQRAPAATSEFLVAQPRVAALILREMTLRREEDYAGRTLPSMERLPAAQAAGFNNVTARPQGVDLYVAYRQNQERQRAERQ